MSQNPQPEPDRHVKFEEIEVAINDVDSLQSEELLRSALKLLPGIRAVRIARGGAMISYNPIGINVAQIRGAIERAGFTVDRIEGGRQSPERRGAEETGKEIWRGPQGKEQPSGLADTPTPETMA
jgi:hypothetical protein